MKRLVDFFARKRCAPLSETRGAIASKYRYFKSLLSHNHAALTAIADMERLYYSGKPFSLTTVRIMYEELLEAVTGVIYSLEALSGNDFTVLEDAVRRMDEELFLNFNPKCAINMRHLVLAFEEITQEMKKMVGAKAANLAVMKNLLGLPVPHGFAVTAYAFEKFIEHNNLLRPIKEELSHVSSESSEEIERASLRLTAMIRDAEAPPELEKEILEAYAAVENKASRDARIAVRSSAVGEDTEATFAGQYETVLNVKKENIIEAYKRVLASKYSARAISYRLHYGLDDRETPMCVACIVMVDSKAAGVLYSVDPDLKRSCPVRINALWGVGEHLVDGSASPDVFVVDRIEKSILERQIARKESRLVSLGRGGLELETVSDAESELPSIDDATVTKLAGYGLLLEEFFERPQDVEWAADSDNNLFILQSRPLQLPEITLDAPALTDFPGHHILLSGGKAASPGVAAGKVFQVDRDEDLNAVPKDAILVSRTASPEYAKVVGRIRGMIIDIGSVTSHMSSVAREFGIPAIVDAGNAMSVLETGRLVTMSAESTTVYDGMVDELVREMKPARRLIFDSPVHMRMRGILDRIAPLNLTDPGSPSFSPGGCRTYHDIIRFTHETAMREMFGLSEGMGQAKVSVKLSAKLPLSLRIVDLGGGLEEGLTSCDTITPERIISSPMKAVWRGFTHPGVNWAGTMSLDRGTLSSLLAVTATSELGEPGGEDSYAVLSRDYLNLSARFAYHFAAIDTLCGDNSSQNYISLQFSGGAGNYYGRSLRIRLIGTVLEKLGFKVSLKGDLIEAFISRYDKKSIEEKLDLTGRLLASSRLLDMTLANREDVDFYADAFFRGEYDFLMRARDDAPRGFYLQGGYWKRVEEEGRVRCIQDGSRWGRGLSSEITGLMGKMVGPAYHEFLDTIEAYYYFPIAVVKDCEIGDGAVSVRIKPMSGAIDRAGGIIFGMRNIDNYFVLRTNALEGNVMLFEYINGRRVQRASMRARIETGVWHSLRVEIQGAKIRGCMDDKTCLEYAAEQAVKGFVGLWTKADSAICFDDFVIESGGEKRVIEF